jgi:hypothetical protein
MSHYHPVSIGYSDTNKEIREDELASNHKTSNRHGLASVCNNLARCYRDAGCFEKARVMLEIEPW